MTNTWTEEQRLAYVKGLPRKRIVASLVAYHGGRLLLVKPTYRAGWLLPGGVVEDGESPAAACAREAREEIGLVLPVRQLLLVDHAVDPGDGSGDSLHFWFATDDLTAAQVEQIVLPADEIEVFIFVRPMDAVEYLIPRMAARLKVLLEHGASGHTICSQDGRAMDGVPSSARRRSTP